MGNLMQCVLDLYKLYVFECYCYLFIFFGVTKLIVLAVHVILNGNASILYQLNMKVW